VISKIVSQVSVRALFAVMCATYPPPQADRPEPLLTLP
jgi:hypothetical protein